MLPSLQVRPLKVSFLLVFLALAAPEAAIGQGDRSEPPTEIIVAESMEPGTPKPGDTITITTLVSVFGRGSFFTSGELVSPNGFTAKVLPEKNQGAVDGRAIWTITTQATLREPGVYQFKYRMWVDSAPKKPVQGVFSFGTEGTGEGVGENQVRRSIGNVAGNKIGADARTTRPAGGWLLSGRKGINSKTEFAGHQLEIGLNTFVLKHEGGARVTRGVWTSPPAHIPSGQPITFNTVMVTVPDKPLDKENNFRINLEVVRPPTVERSRLIGDATFTGHDFVRNVLTWSANAASSVTLTPNASSSAPFSLRLVLYTRGMAHTLAEYSYAGVSPGAAPAVPARPTRK